MVYEVKVNELAEEFGVHRNTIRNWINSGTLPAQEGPGRRYLIQAEDYHRLCDKFGRKPKAFPAAQAINAPAQEQPTPQAPPVPIRLSLSSIHLFPDPALADCCVTCGSCAGACPIAGVDDLDPRKIIRMALLGLEEEILASDWPWKCTLCGRCEESCPANVKILELMRSIRGQRDRAKVPHPIQKGVTTCLEKGNNLGIPKDDFLQLVKGLGTELGETICPGFTTPVDVRGARLLVTVNSKEPFVQPRQLMWWWRIFYAAQESWTLSSENWEGVNWGFYSGDDSSMKTIVERIVDNMERLNCQALLLPECGHAYYATRYGLEKWFPESARKFKIYSIFDLLLEYLTAGRINLDPTIHNKLTTLHDSCNYGRKSLKAFGHGYFSEGRTIVQACCTKFREMIPNSGDSYCCGAGGGAWASPYAAERVFHGREKARQIKASGAKLVVTSCHNCKDQIAHSLAPEFNLEIEVKSLWELVAQALVPAS
ncbi:4Fe-4S dicluster domain-containing protein [Desulfogranum mediterraneum]|uniref:4Fe-4S dicluster domain-containing protein n=1 Tax=Desulfogranum mediterraneum TaxID=160661 RepID=UPI00041D2DD5|nr:4Fe-4S dicluster domain-containing protein [Desulfogranum mediterraneum]